MTDPSGRALPGNSAIPIDQTDPGPGLPAGSGRTGSLRLRITGLYALLITANALAWIWAFAALHGRPLLLGMALLAYSFGLRHAVDPDHIAAIDNVVRKLMNDGKKPVSVGLFFALGHSTVVVLASIVIAFASSALNSRFHAFQALGAIVGTSISALFLLVIALMNVFILRGVFRAFRQIRAGRYNPADLDMLTPPGGLMARLFRPLFAMITNPWLMYPLGLLFGLGFETATEVALLGMSADSAAHGLPITTILVFPALFTAGMTLVDTSDGVLMLGAYGWAFLHPVRKVFYNLVITSGSVLVALGVGGIEVLALIRQQFGLSGPFWHATAMLEQNFDKLGYFVIALFAVSWLVAMAVYRLKRYDEIEVEAVPE